MPSRSNYKLRCKQYYKKYKTSQNNKKKSKKNQYRLSKKNNSHIKRVRTQRGGFKNCALATVQEPGFIIPAIGNVPGFNLTDSKGVINRSNCKNDNYHAMT